jgi:hypothetical protein
MTAVLKPLKFLQPHYPELQKQYEEWPESPVKVCLAFLGLVNFAKKKKNRDTYHINNESREDATAYD